jgi:O-antigen/teichoic acid export membrane protein
MPSLAIRDIAAASELERPDLIGRLVGLAALTAVGVAGIGTLVGKWLVPEPAQPYLTALIWSLVLTASSRTALNYFQGVGRISVIARLSIYCSIASFGAVAALVAVFGIRGWIFGRYVGEVLLLGMTLLALRHRLRFQGFLPLSSIGRLWRRGAVISTGFLVRTAQDNGVTLALAWLGASQQVGFYGLAGLLLTPVLLVPSVIGNLALPRFVSLHKDMTRLRPEIRRFALATMSVALFGAIAAVAVIPSVIKIIFPEYSPALSVLYILILSIPLRALNSIAGALLMADDRNGTALLINVVSLTIAVGCCAVLIPYAGSVGAAWAVLIADVCASVMCAVTTRRIVQAGMHWTRPHS